MECHFEATEEFLMRQNEIHILLGTASEKSEENGNKKVRSENILRK